MSAIAANILILCFVHLGLTSLSREKALYYVGRHGNYTWPRRELAVSRDGDVVLGALHMVHERSEDKTCGPIMSQGGVQALETMLFTLDYINSSPDVLPHVELGILAKDDCDRDIYGLEQAVDFIRVAWGSRGKSHYAGRHGNYTLPRHERYVYMNGDVILGALHTLQRRSEFERCGYIDSQGIQTFEAMMYTLDTINKNPYMLPNVALGVLAKDDCGNPTYGLELALKFITGSIASIGGSDYTCRDGSRPDMHPKVIPGVMGAPSSVTSIQVANLLKLFKIPQVSFFSTSPVLSNRDRFPFFLRTIPSDVNQAQAIVKLVRMFNWTYVSLVYEESSYGEQGADEIRSLLAEHGICIATQVKLLKDSGVPNEDFYDNLVHGLKNHAMAKGVIIFASDQEVGELMKAVRRVGATGLFSWIGSDGWGGRGLAYLGKEAEVEGAITVQPLAYEVRGFKDYFLSLTPFNNNRNPWFVEFWEQNFKCKFPGSSWTPYNDNYNSTCTGAEKIDPNTFIMEAQLQFVSDSILAFAFALHNMHVDLCGPNHVGLCEAMEPIDGELLKDYLLQVNFTGLSGQHFQFLPNGDGPARYRILNFRQTSPGKYSWETVGFFDNGQLLDMNDLQFRLDEPKHPESFCSRPCGPGEAKAYSSGDQCCWVCLKCHKYQYLPTAFECKDCPLGRVPSADLSHCISLPVIYLRYDDGMAVVAMAFAAIGIIITGYVTVIFVRFSETPIVKASGRELSFVLLFGIFLCYTMTFILVQKPHPVSCGAQKFGLGLCFSICYSAILTKTNRIARIFRAGMRTAKRPKFISPKSQLVICGGIAAFQNAVGIIWLLMRPPDAVAYFANRNDHQLVCQDAVGGYYMIGFTYPIILVIICTIYAILTRKIPEAFNESKYIGFTMYTTCIIWLAFVPIYFSTAYDIKLRIVTMSYSVSLSATVALVCMFTPKLYVILTHPEKNVRKSMMTTNKTLTTNSTYPSVQNNTVNCQYSSIQTNDKYAQNPVEMVQNALPESYSSGLSRSICSATQTNGHSISTQTLDSMDDLLNNKDVAL